MRQAVLLIALIALVGCGSKEITSADIPKTKDAYVGMTPEQKIDAIRNDVKIPDMERHQKLAEAQKAAGLPVTGQ